MDAKYDTNSMVRKLNEINFSKVIKLSDEEGCNYSFDIYRRNGFKHNVEGFCTSCEEKGCNYSEKSPDYKLATISHGTHTMDFLRAMIANKPDISSWHGKSVMFIFESPSNEDEKYTSVTYRDVNKKPVKEWYWIHKDKKYSAEFPEYFNRSKQYGNLIFSIINTFQLKNAYVTNLVKCGLNNEKRKFKGLEYFSSECVFNCFENILKQEIGIVQPSVIFAFSKNVEKWLGELMPDFQVPVYYLPHPASRIKNKERKLYYLRKLIQGLYENRIINEEYVSKLSLKHLLGSID